MPTTSWFLSMTGHDAALELLIDEQVDGLFVGAADQQIDFHRLGEADQADQFFAFDDRRMMNMRVAH